MSLQTDDEIATGLGPIQLMIRAAQEQGPHKVIATDVDRWATVYRWGHRLASLKRTKRCLGGPVTATFPLDGCPDETLRGYLVPSSFMQQAFAKKEDYLPTCFVTLDGEVYWWTAGILTAVQYDHEHEREPKVVVDRLLRTWFWIKVLGFWPWLCWRRLDFVCEPGEDKEGDIK